MHHQQEIVFPLAAKKQRAVVCVTYSYVWSYGDVELEPRRKWTVFVFLM